MSKRDNKFKANLIKKNPQHNTVKTDITKLDSSKVGNQKMDYSAKLAIIALIVSVITGLF